MLASLLLPLSLQGSFLAQLDDQEFCKAMIQSASDFAGSPGGVIKRSKGSADCAAKQLTVELDLDLSGASFEAYVGGFLGGARNTACDLKDPDWANIYQRGWRFAYRFTASDGRTRNDVVTC
jgi:hypothetical protein